MQIDTIWKWKTDSEMITHCFQKQFKQEPTCPSSHQLYRYGTIGHEGKSLVLCGEKMGVRKPEELLVRCSGTVR